MSTQEVSNRIELLFFDPLKTRDDYIERFKEIYPEEKHYAYSPLFDLQAQIVELDRREFWFPVVLLLNILIEGVAANILASTTEKVSEGVDVFYERYTQITKIEGVILREFRNAREHNFSQFIGRLYQKKKQPFSTLFESFPEIEKAHKDSNSYIKMAFSASLGGTKVADYIFQNFNRESNYYLISPHINPMLFRATIFSAIEKLKKDVEENTILQRNIMANLKVENWTHIIYSAAESSDGKLGFDAPFLKN